MFLWISGFLKDDDEDDALKYDLTVQPEYEAAVMAILSWKNLAESPEGEWLLTNDQVKQLSIAIDEHLPMDLELYISVRG
ncbi:pyocin S6 family toxin immunity protein [Pseudomonas sp. CCC3.1]|uniref:pyocin S6 family toxin immunity protein n=1 Tax=Pseudomonas sp. CCC3.1 TaxID=3048607 RepID=UPI002AC8F78B|nr:pyocin S6 family toxin immunity protein [Pseudomonas sp. CCC3.1]MEB0205730.1 pyocin S6 family toxin immunity protein [Pseudomonas sp. CCC3.1]WPX35914.1 pyocin S6 family toxin immunity protein [Pseudomonas sp. CCC3.1]